jgi:hypothetical protein
MCVVVCMGSRIVRRIHVLPCPHNEVHTALVESPSTMRKPSGRLLSLVDLEGVDLSPYVDVLGVSDKLRGNRVILVHVQAQRIAQQRVKSAKGGAR